jgi:copper chaperone CopZ
MDAEEIVRVGYLTKKGAFKVGGWKKRYVVLKRPTSGKAVLSYYRKETDATPAGEIVLDQSTLAYHNVDSDKPFAFSIQTKGRTYELLASSEVGMRGWIETTMQAALGILESKKAPKVDMAAAAAQQNAWLKFRALGMQCECCWEQVPEALRAVDSVELVRIDAMAEIVSVKVGADAKVEQLVERVIAILEQRFGFLCSFVKA